VMLSVKPRKNLLLEKDQKNRRFRSQDSIRFIGPSGMF
jgi:hypothetical protein